MTEEHRPGEGIPQAEGGPQQRTVAESHHVRPQEQPDPPLEKLEPDSRTLNIVETLLFSSDAPLTFARLAEIAEVDTHTVRKAVEVLNRLYEENNRTFRIHRVAQGFQMYTLPEYSEWVRKMYKRQFVQRLSNASLEVLAIIGYKQPVTRPEIEKLRGVDCSGPLLTLLERRLIAAAGRAKRPGSPLLYRTTREFLRYFGLETLEDLPPLEELGAFLADVLEGRRPEAEKREAESLAIEPATRIEKPEAGSGPGVQSSQNREP
ncbi:MAG: SMC-Scp complex subunit ScpB [candidate division WOR-3 bacterium]|nr:MAG: SMC-Scp complex subunit ScpB [candidate division WOR-3 bacterium]